MKLSDLATKFGGEVIRNANIDIDGICTAMNQKKGCIFAISDNRILKNAMKDNFIGAAAIISHKVSDFPDFPHILVDDVRDYQRLLIDFFNPQKKISPYISPRCSIDSSSTIGEYCYVGDFSCIGANVKIGNGSYISDNVTVGENVIIGENCFIAAGVRLYRNVKIGNNVRIHSNAVIGADGFGYVSKNGLHKINHIGSVVVSDYVEIGANTCIDRGTIDDTFIGYGSKIDNLVQIAHNCHIGENCMIAGHAALSGSVKLGDNIMVGGQVGFGDNIKISSNTIFAARTGIHEDISEPGIYGGAPAVQLSKFRRYAVLLKDLPEMKKKLDKISQEILFMDEGRGENGTDL